VDIDFGNGKRGVFEMIEFNLSEDQQWWVIICAYDESSKEIIMIEQFQVALWKRTFLLPRWWLNPGQTWLQTAKQELLEETGYEAKEWKELSHIYSSPWFFSQNTKLFLAQWISKSAMWAEWDEIEETIAHKVLLSDAVNMIMQWIIVDARTICWLMIAKEYLSNSKVNIKN
jgi:ADP-ribose pyrophosphatase